MTPGPSSYWVVRLDIEDFSRRADVGQTRPRQQLYVLVELAVRDAGLERDRGPVEDLEDGLLVLFSETVNGPRLLRGLDDALAEHRVVSSENSRIRLRVGLARGLVAVVERGLAGAVVDDLARLVDAAPVRQALAQVSRARLVLVVSDDVYRSVVQAGNRGVVPAAYGRVQVVTKNGRTLQGWATIPVIRGHLKRS